MPKPLAFVLSSLVDGREFDGMSEGSFSDMYGRAITLEGKLFSEFAANTQAAIDATATDSGEIVGLPIDARGHENGDGAGWIVGVRHEVRKGKNMLRFTPKWTSIGRDLIDGGIRRMFSPTVDIANRVVLGGSLTNWPATRAKNGRTILRPIELEQGVDKMEEELIVAEEAEAEAVVETPAELPAPPVQLEALLADDAGIASQVREYVQLQIANGVSKALELMRAENEVDGFVAQLSLPAKPDEVKAFLLSLNGEQREQAKGLLTQFSTAIAAGMSEQGHSAKLDGRAELPDSVKVELAKHLANGGSLDVFFEWNKSELGVKSDYNLSQYEEKE